MKFQVLTLWNFRFSHCEILSFHIVKFQVLTLWNFKFKHCEISNSHIMKFQVLTLWNFKFSHYKISSSHILNFRFSRCEISSSHIVKFQILTLWNFKFSHCEFQVLTLWNFKFSHCEILSSHITKFQVLTVVTMMITVFWDVIIYYVVWQICTNFWRKQLHPSEYFEVSGSRFIWGVEVVVTRLLACWHWVKRHLAFTTKCYLFITNTSTVAEGVKVLQQRQR